MLKKIPLKVLLTIWGLFALLVVVNAILVLTHMLPAWHWTFFVGETGMWTFCFLILFRHK